MNTKVEEMTAKEQGLPELPEASLLNVYYTAAQMRAYALAALASDTGERGGVDCIGLALDLEQQAERGVASQTAERAMRAAAAGLRSLAAHRAQPEPMDFTEYRREHDHGAER